MSTGMAEIKEIEQAIKVLKRFGTRKENISILHCTTDYPAAYSELNLKAIQTLQNHFKLKIGYSDHSLGIEIASAAIAFGAEILEKHLTLDRKMDGPDHLASIDPDDFKMMVKNIRNIEEAIGNGDKVPTRNELINKDIVRKSIVALQDIHEGEIFNEKNLTSKRPGSGINPMHWEAIIGQTSKRNFKKDELIDL